MWVDWVDKTVQKLLMVLLVWSHNSSWMRIWVYWLFSNIDHARLYLLCLISCRKLMNGFSEILALLVFKIFHIIWITYSRPHFILMMWQQFYEFYWISKVYWNSKKHYIVIKNYNYKVCANFIKTNILIKKILKTVIVMTTNL